MALRHPMKVDRSKERRNGLAYYFYVLLIHGKPEWIRREGHLVSYHKPSVMRMLKTHDYKVLARALNALIKDGLIAEQKQVEPGWYRLELLQMNQEYLVREDRA